MSESFLYVPEIVPIFPLPEVVLFPRTILPLHVFEPRYREMLEDALAGDRVIAVALLKPGYGPLYYTRRAPIHHTIGVGQIVGSEQVEDGNYNMLLRGVGRARLVEEKSDRAYRQGRIEPLTTFCSRDDVQAEALRAELFKSIRGNVALDPELRKHWLKLAEAELALDAVSDLIAAGVPVEAELKQVLLDEPDAYARGKLLLDQIQTLAAIAQNTRRVFGPDGYSMN